MRERVESRMLRFTEDRGSTGQGGGETIRIQHSLATQGLLDARYAFPSLGLTFLIYEMNIFRPNNV